MINLFGAHINSLSIHRVGNKINNEPIFLSDDIYKGGELVAYDPRANANRGYSGKMAEMFEPIEYAPQTGDVIIMPGYVYHSVKTYHSNLRLAVPVDIFIK